MTSGQEVKGSAEVLALSVAAGRTVREAASLSGMSESTARRRLRGPKLRRRIDDLRADLAREATGRLLASMTEASEVLRELLKDGSAASGCPRPGRSCSWAGTCGVRSISSGGLRRLKGLSERRGPVNRNHLNRLLDEAKRSNARDEARGADCSQYRSDPAGYARDVLGVRWWSRQIEI